MIVCEFIISGFYCARRGAIAMDLIPADTHIYRGIGRWMLPGRLDNVAAVVA